MNTASKRRIASIKRDDALILRHYANPTGWNFRERQPEVAHMLGISQATVKTHLKRIFDKTGTARQSDLVKLVAGFTGPFDVLSEPPKRG